MPSQANLSTKSPRGDICVFGDSHIGSVKKALDANLIDTNGRNVTFWGAGGPKFHELRWKNGRIVPGAKARDVVAQINGGTHPTLAPGDFDLFIFYGARLKVHEFMQGMIPHLRKPEGQLSSAAMRVVVDGWVQRTRGWDFARRFSMGKSRVVYVPTSFPTKGITKPHVEKKRFQMKATKDERAFLWGHLTQAAARNGFSLIPQPESTVTPDGLTKAKYAADVAAEKRDYDHKTGEFAAQLMQLALAEADGDTRQIAA